MCCFYHELAVSSSKTPPLVLLFSKQFIWWTQWKIVIYFELHHCFVKLVKVSLVACVEETLVIQSRNLWYSHLQPIFSVWLSTSVSSSVYHEREFHSFLHWFIPKIYRVYRVISQVVTGEHFKLSQYILSLSYVMVEVYSFCSSGFAQTGKTVNFYQKKQLVVLDTWSLQT